MKVIFPYPLPFGLFTDIYEYVTALTALGIEAQYVGWSPTEGTPRFLRHLAQQIEFMRPDIVHVFHFRGSGILPFWVKGKPKPKWIIDVRTIHVQNKTFGHDPFFPLKDRITWFETQMYNYVFTLTPHIAGKMSPSCRPIKITPLGANGDRWDNENRKQIRCTIRSQLSIPAEAPTVLYSGSTSPARRLDKVIEAFAKATQAAKDARLLIVGGIPNNPQASSQYASELQDLAHRLGIAHQVVLTGFIPYSEIFPYYFAADIGISFTPNGTPYEYQPPTKLIEYMMAGLLALTNKTPATSELVRDGQSGILCNDSVEGIEMGISRAFALLQEPDHLKAVLDCAKAGVLWRDWRSIVATYVLPTYESLLKNENPI
jgi:glycosyltransferase involved in cell wall biosynthesis